MDQNQVPPGLPPTPLPPTPPQPVAAQDVEPKAFKLYRGRAPLSLQIIAGLMWLNALGLIISGLLQLLAGLLFPILLVMGAGLIVLGALLIKYAKGIFKLQRHAYKPAIVILTISLAAEIYSLISNAALGIDWVALAELIFGLLAVMAIYYYRRLFTHD